MSKETGGSAFPVQAMWRPDGELYQWPESGMTLRDYFAAAALMRCIEYHGAESVEYGNADKAASAAYQIADAMLAERSKN